MADVVRTADLGDLGVAECGLRGDRSFDDDSLRQFGELVCVFGQSDLYRWVFVGDYICVKGE